jgi:hypothetical protein
VRRSERRLLEVVGEGNGKVVAWSTRIGAPANTDTDHLSDISRSLLLQHYPYPYPYWYVPTSP